MRSAVPGKARVHELAKELGVESKTVLAKLKEMGEFVKSASSTVEAPVARRLRGAFAAQSQAPAAAPSAPSAPAASSAAPAAPTLTPQHVSARPAPPRRATPAPAPGPTARPKTPAPNPPQPAPVAKPASAHDIEVAAAEERAARLKRDQEVAVKAAQQAAKQRDTARREPPADGVT